MTHSIPGEQSSEIVGATRFQIGDRVEYRVRADGGRKLRRGRITFLHGGGNAQVTDDSMPDRGVQKFRWFVSLEQCVKLPS